MKNGKVNLAIVGCGHFGRYHAEAFSKLRGVRLVGFCNRTLDKAKALAQKFGGEITTTDPDDVLASKDIDGVIIATHHDSHADLCQRAALAGKYVLVEKPLGMNLKQCEDLVEAVRGHERRISVGYKLRFFPTIQRARKLLQTPTLIIGQYMDDKWDPNWWANDPTVGGGSVLSGGCHALDMICYLARSRPVRVYAEGASVAHPNHPCFDQMNGLLAFENGAMGVWIQSQTAIPVRAGKYQFSLFGTTGVAIELYDGLQSGSYRIGARTDEVTRAGDEAIYYQAVAFVAQIADGASPACSLLDGLLANLLLEACRRANQLKRPQEILWKDNSPFLD